MEHSRGSTKRADAVTNRARILEVAQSVFAERGLELEMNEVASQAHLGVGTLYGHFANREELLRAIVQRTIDDILAQLRETQVSHANDPRAALQALVLAGLRVHQQYRHLFAVMRDPRLAKLLDPLYGQNIRKQFLEVPTEMIDRGIQTGIFHVDLDREMVAVTIMGTFSSAIDLLEMHCSLDELAQRLSHFLLTMFTGKSAT